MHFENADENPPPQAQADDDDGIEAERDLTASQLLEQVVADFVSSQRGGSVDLICEFLVLAESRLCTGGQ